MEDKNILTEGIETLQTIKENLLELLGYQEKSRMLSEEELRLDDEIIQKEKQINNEIEVLVKKRREEVSNSFDDQMNKTEARIKKVKSRKERFKDSKVSERIKLETADLEEERVLFSEDIKEVYKLDRISRIFNNQVFYALYMPRSLKDIGILLLVVLLIAGALPFGIYYFLLPDKNVYIAVSYIIVLIAAVGIYILIKRITKDKHKKSFEKIKEIRTKLFTNRKSINALKKAIVKDKDESSYGLEKFQDEIDELEQQKKTISSEQKKALAAFESSTKNAISEGVWQNYKKEIDEIKLNHDKIYEEEKETESLAKEFAIEIAKKYEAYVGREMLELRHIDELIKIMETNEVSTINEAMRIYKTRSEVAEIVQKEVREENLRH